MHILCLWTSLLKQKDMLLSNVYREIRTLRASHLFITTFLFHKSVLLGFLIILNIILPIAYGSGGLFHGIGRRSRRTLWHQLIGVFEEPPCQVPLSAIETTFKQQHHGTNQGWCCCLTKSPSTADYFSGEQDKPRYYGFSESHNRRKLVGKK